MNKDKNIKSYCHVNAYFRYIIFDKMITAKWMNTYLEWWFMIWWAAIHCELRIIPCKPCAVIAKLVLTKYRKISHCMVYNSKWKLQYLYRIITTDCIKMPELSHTKLHNWDNLFLNHRSIHIISKWINRINCHDVAIIRAKDRNLFQAIEIKNVGLCYP